MAKVAKGYGTISGLKFLNRLLKGYFSLYRILLNCEWLIFDLIKGAKITLVMFIHINKVVN